MLDINAVIGGENYTILDINRFGSDAYVSVLASPESSNSHITNPVLVDDSARYGRLSDITMLITTEAGAAYATNPVLIDDAARFARMTLDESELAVIATVYPSEEDRTNDTSAIGSSEPVLLALLPATITISGALEFDLAEVTAEILSGGLDFNVETVSSGNFLSSIYASPADRAANDNVLDTTTSAYDDTPATISIIDFINFDVDVITAADLPLDFDVGNPIKSLKISASIGSPNIVISTSASLG